MSGPPFGKKNGVAANEICPVIGQKHQLKIDDSSPWISPYLFLELLWVPVCPLL